MCTNVPNIYLVGQPMLTHKAVRDRHVAGSGMGRRHYLGMHAGEMIGAHRAGDRDNRLPASTSARRSTRIRPWGESIGMVAEVYEGVCTDLSPPCKS